MSGLMSVASTKLVPARTSTITATAAGLLPAATDALVADRELWLAITARPAAGGSPTKRCVAIHAELNKLKCMTTIQ